MNSTILQTLKYLLIVVSISTIVTILLQNRTEGLGLMFGGGGETYRSKRGLQKVLHNATIILVIVMGVLSFTIVKYS